MVIMIIIYYYNYSYTYYNYSLFLGIGTTFGCFFVVTSIIIASVLGDGMSLLELTSTAFSLFFLIVTGIVELTFHPTIPAGVLTLLTAAIFLIDLVFLIRNTKFSFHTNQTN